MSIATDRVFTCGYQGRTIVEFVSMLKSSGVTVVVDVRSRPISRRPGFSKIKLATALDESGIKYEHFKDLGMPEQWLPLRSERDGNREVLALYRGSMTDRYSSIRELSQLASRETICLVCFESDHTHCHRSVVADSLRSRSFEIRHLT